MNITRHLRVRETRVSVEDYSYAPVAVEIEAGNGEFEIKFTVDAAKAPKVGDLITMTVEWGVEE